VVIDDDDVDPARPAARMAASSLVPQSPVTTSVARARRTTRRRRRRNRSRPRAARPRPGGDPDPAQEAGHQGAGGDPVDVVVAEAADLLAGADRRQMRSTARDSPARPDGGRELGQLGSR
jgi:hypothetical protein